MKRKKYSKQFKEEAVRVMEAGDKSPAFLARELGVRRNQLYKWQKQVRLKGDAAFPGGGQRKVKRSLKSNNFVVEWRCLKRRTRY
jgi:transposase-like protein